MTSKQVEVAVITGAHGIKGQVTIRSFTNPPEAITNIDALSNASGNKTFRLKITGHKKNVLIATVENIIDRNQAELLKGTALYAASDNPALPAQSNLPGMKAHTKDGELYGEITGVHNFGAGDIVEIKKPDGSNEMLPLAKGFVEIIDNIVVVTPPEYMETKG